MRIARPWSSQQHGKLGSLISLPLQMERCAKRDWLQDAIADEWGVRMFDVGALHLSLFKLADMWTDSVGPDVYANFLVRLCLAGYSYPEFQRSYPLMMCLFPQPARFPLPKGPLVATDVLARATLQCSGSSSRSRTTCVAGLDSSGCS